MPTAAVFERLADETITTPAGEFVNCHHYHIAGASVIDIKIAKITAAEEREVWYHSEVHGIVKEVYRKKPIKFLAWSQQGYTATSVLTNFIEEVPTEDFVPARNISSENRQLPVNTSFVNQRLYIVLLVIVIILVIIIVLVIVILLAIIKKHIKAKRKKLKQGSMN